MYLGLPFFFSLRLHLSKYLCLLCSENANLADTRVSSSNSCDFSANIPRPSLSAPEEVNTIPFPSISSKTDLRPALALRDKSGLNGVKAEINGTQIRFVIFCSAQ